MKYILIILLSIFTVACGGDGDSNKDLIVGNVEFSTDYINEDGVSESLLLSCIYLNNNNENKPFEEWLQTTNVDNITTIDCSDEYFLPMSDISALQYFTELLELNLNSKKQIDDIKVLEKLSKLSILDIGSTTNYDEDINWELEYSVIGKLQHLTSLNLAYNRINDFNFINELSSLTYLNIYGTDIFERGGVIATDQGYYTSARDWATCEDEYYESLIGPDGDFPEQFNPFEVSYRYCNSQGFNSDKDYRYRWMRNNVTQYTFNALEIKYIDTEPTSTDYTIEEYNINIILTTDYHCKERQTSDPDAEHYYPYGDYSAPHIIPGSELCWKVSDKITRYEGDDGRIKVESVIIE